MRDKNLITTNYLAARPITKVDGLTLEMFEKPIFHADGYVQHGA